MSTSSQCPRRPGPFLLSALSLTMCASGAVHAAETATLPATQVSAAATEGREGYSAESTSTASKSDVPIKEEAQSVNVVTPQTIADYNVRSLDDAMKFVSGVSQGNTLGNTKDSVIKRGFGTNDDGSILRDGVRSVVSKNFGATTERVEVLKGPASLLYGAMEPGGVINVISKQPQYVQSTTLSGSAYSEGGGSFDIDTTGPLGDSGLAYRLVAERQSEDYWRNYGVDQHTLIAPSLSWTGERASLTLAYEYNDYISPFDRGTVFTGGHPADISYDKRLDEKWANTVGISETATARFEYQLSDDWKTRLTYGWNNDRYSLSIAQPSTLSSSGVLRRQANGGHYDYETRYASWDFIGKQEILGQQHDLLIGAEQEDSDKYRGKTYRNTAQNGFNIFSPSYGSLAEPSVVSTTTSNLSNQLTSSSIYLKDNWHLDDRWILVLGGRYQHYDQYIKQGLGASRVTNLDKNDDVFLPMAGLVFKVNEDLSLYGNYSRSFVPNDDVNDDGTTFDPEEGRSYEVGAKYALAPALNLNLAVFDIEKKNVVTPTGVTGVSEAAGKVGSQGMELDVTGRIAERWDMIGTYAYTHTEVLDDPSNKGNRLSQAPKHTASLYLTHHLQVPSGLGDWHAGGGARYVGERAGDDANTFYMSSYTVADAFLRWDVPMASYKTRLQLNVDNLFDKQYYPSSTGSQLQVNVGEPRTARLSASVTF
ncbi:TonB-dependent siderophore receptor [Pseudomonas savastanoi pv. phaseolicola]|uniref:Ferrichrome-iron receptor n=3 Tax=Pseudomonas savastanoi TaxID=29438 RepID=A0A3M3G2L3_PSESG|nr:MULTISPECIES: TonB-dependent siderophore receptor [Pseudomonas]KPY10859.1 TonB-dependent siderophore receptor [Pseudomonas savastanoi pv. phaseolicola]MBN4181264.1 Ferrichrome outer membrane transporter/phage receptor [Pseudomonas savastanoi pv. phaseolicola]MDG6379098.1 TonB-dependent siderophore receptor [Pseudomonas savastanoi pv. phaseolicola]MDG6390844.1 TonB-dependent siderophore receptor [Pseudomonas savastanoi pv. phaseolicola]QDW01406.1 TonB-dependent siderophore receptor [Pseudomo